MKFGILLAIALVLLTVGCRRRAAPAAADAGPLLRVTVAAVAPTRSLRTQEVAGTVRPFARATVAAKISGAVVNTRIVVGQPVAAGTVLVELQAAELTARSDQAAAALAQAEREYAREQTMEVQGASTVESVRAAEDRRRQARAAAEEAASMLAYTRIAAPFSGVITDEFVKIGDLATPGRPLFALEGTDRLRAEAQIPESLQLPALGSEISLKFGDTAATGRLVELSPAADPSTRSRIARIELPADSTARSGQFVRVLWPTREDTMLTVPASAVSVLGQMERVFAVVNDRAELRLVKTGAREGERIELLSGVDAGEIVVLNPPSALRDGQRVERQP